MGAWRQKKCKFDFTPRTDEQENMSGFFPPPPTISMAEKVGFLIVPKLTSIKIGALGETCFGSPWEHD